MKIFPAIDLRNGACVRLYQGDYDQETVYDPDPLAQAQRFLDEQADCLHLVDLDAALTGEQQNLAVIESICSLSSVPVQVGGGVRSHEQAEKLFTAGASRIVIGTAAYENPQLVEDLVKAGGSVAVGLDTKSGNVATHGWTEDSGVPATDMAKQFAETGVDAFVVTDIAKDGTLTGPDTIGVSDILKATSVPVVASGGVGTIDDLHALAALAVTVAAEDQILEGVIVGKALYEKAFTLTEARKALS